MYLLLLVKKHLKKIMHICGCRKSGQMSWMVDLSILAYHYVIWWVVKFCYLVELSNILQ